VKLSVIIPVYNEAATIEKIIARVAAVPMETEIIVVDDGSTDGTTERVRALMAGRDESCLRVLFHEKNCGKGAAIITGLRHVTGEVVTIQDADLEYHPEDYPLAVRLIADGYADAVFGSRFLGPHRVFMFWHYAGNKLLTLLLNVLFNSTLTDMETGFKLIRHEALRELNIRSRGFDFEPEVTAKLLKRKYRIYEIPITYTGRTYDEGKKITWRDGLRALWAILKFRVCD